MCVRLCVCVCEQRCIDGALSNNIPVLDDATITVSPFAGESDISPDDLSPSLHHINLAGDYQFYSNKIIIIIKVALKTAGVPGTIRQSSWCRNWEGRRPTSQETLEKPRRLTCSSNWQWHCKRGANAVSFQNTFTAGWPCCKPVIYSFSSFNI